MSSIEPLSERQQTEVRHRFANVFQLLSALTRMRVQRTQDPETRRQLSWMLDATGVLAAMQQRLLGPDPDDFAGYLRDLAPQWNRRSAGRPIEVLLVLERVPVREHLISALTLIANELVINAVEHAFPHQRAGVVRVELRPLEDGRAELIVSDDGAGFGPPVPGRPSLGLWLIWGLTDQVKGVMTTPPVEVGVTSRLEFSPSSTVERPPSRAAGGNTSDGQALRLVTQNFAMTIGAMRRRVPRSVSWIGGVLLGLVLALAFSEFRRLEHAAGADREIRLPGHRARDRPRRRSQGPPLVLVARGRHRRAEDRQSQGRSGPDGGHSAGAGQGEASAAADRPLGHCRCWTWRSRPSGCSWAGTAYGNWQTAKTKGQPTRLPPIEHFIINNGRLGFVDTPRHLKISGLLQSRPDRGPTPGQSFIPA